MECSSLAVASLPIPLPSLNTSRGSLFGFAFGDLFGICSWLQDVASSSFSGQPPKKRSSHTSDCCFHMFPWVCQKNIPCLQVDGATETALLQSTSCSALLVFVSLLGAAVLDNLHSVPRCTCNCILHSPQIGSSSEFESLRVCGLFL